MMTNQSIYKSPEGEATVLEMYDRFQANMGIHFEDLLLDTRFGATHILATGPRDAPPVVITHGGNQTNLLYLLAPSRTRLARAVQWMGDELGKDDLEWSEVAFRHIRIEAQMPRPASKRELERLRAPTLVSAAEHDVMFPGKAVIKRAREIIPNLVAAECLEGGTHYSSEKDMEYVNNRIWEFLETDKEGL